MITTLDNIENEYRNKVESILENRELNALLLIELSASLFQELKIENISGNESDDSDMLLYQYGVYDWGDEFGEHFSFDITRQFFKPEEDEPYQLNFTLIYESEQFKALKDYNCWSMSFSDLENFIEHIKTTEGYRLADTSTPNGYIIGFSQC